jgi:hypothetical protein
MPVTRCSICHRKLTDPYSVALGVGPECRGKYPKGHFPKPKWRVERGRVVFDGLAVNSTKLEKRNVKTEEEE